IKKIESDKTRLKGEKLSDEGMLKLQEVMERYEGEYKLVWSDTVQEELKSRPKKAMHMSGIPLIDDLLGGLREQMMIGLAAHSGHGKTAMGLYLLKQYEYLNPILIPLEQSTEELIEQRE